MSSDLKQMGLGRGANTATFIGEAGVNLSQLVTYHGLDPAVADVCKEQLHAQIPSDFVTSVLGQKNWLSAKAQALEALFGKSGFHGTESDQPTSPAPRFTERDRGTQSSPANRFA